MKNDYDGLGRLCLNIDELNNTTLYTYDELNRIKKKTFPDESILNYEYTFDTNKNKKINTIFLTSSNSQKKQTLCTESVDSLDRRVEYCYDNKTHRHEYHGASKEIAKHITPQDESTYFTSNFNHSFREARTSNKKETSEINKAFINRGNCLESYQNAKKDQEYDYSAAGVLEKEIFYDPKYPF
uniref:hypothetical protein n=1 Tax=Candidatus Sodalis endolongispinus TaxID=2812662 RepID=UPI0028A816B2|nr:hypothetical protein [Candidatus Sodalis endolongispinus]